MSLAFSCMFLKNQYIIFNNDSQPLNALLPLIILISQPDLSQHDSIPWQCLLGSHAASPMEDSPVTIHLSRTVEGTRACSLLLHQEDPQRKVLNSWWLDKKELRFSVSINWKESSSPHKELFLEWCAVKPATLPPLLFLSFGS